MKTAPKRIVIIIKTQANEEFRVRTSLTSTVLDLKKYVLAYKGISVTKQNLIFMSKELSDETTIEEVGLVHESSVQLMIKMTDGFKTRLLNAPKTTPIKTTPTNQHYNYMTFVKTLVIVRQNEKIVDRPVNNFYRVDTNSADMPYVHKLLTKKVLLECGLSLVVLFDHEDFTGEGATFIKLSLDPNGKDMYKKLLANCRKNNTSESEGEEVKKKVRCGECKLKLNETKTYGCRCEKYFCIKHRLPETHVCTFDYKSEGKKELEKKYPVVVPSKIDKI